MKDNNYYKQANLLLEILPLIDIDKDFAIKGGTAINFFVRDFPRLSVDIDLTYLPVNTRTSALDDIHNKMINLKKRIEKRFSNSRISPKSKEDKVYGLIVNIGDLPIKIEPNLVIRGTVFEPLTKSLVPKASNYFEKFIEAQIMSIPDLYGGKICAALDRQHPRDLFDVKLLMRYEGITEEIKQAFIIYLLSHPRPIIELLNPSLKDITKTFINEFQGMTINPISLDDLLETRDELIRQVNRSLNKENRIFIASFKNKKPDWQLFPLSNVSKLPAIQWKLLNLRRMEKSKHKEALIKLLNFLEVDPNRAF
jgi:predicted nucleotidyltransferase component of viral defense system